MSLGRLLSSGKTLIGAYGETHRFRVNKRVALPKFVSPNNPFASGAQQECAEARTTTAAMPTKAKVRATNAPAPPAALRKLSPVRAFKWVGELGAKLNPLAMLRRRGGLVANAQAGVTAPIQRELSLDTVRVLRNDLSDCDLELVPKKAVEPEPAVVKVREMEVPVVKVQPLWARVRSLIWRRR